VGLGRGRGVKTGKLFGVEIEAEFHATVAFVARSSPSCAPLRRRHDSGHSIGAEAPEQGAIHRGTGLKNKNQPTGGAKLVFMMRRRGTSAFREFPKRRSERLMSRSRYRHAAAEPRKNAQAPNAEVRTLLDSIIISSRPCRLNSYLFRFAT
jgi:hypothetical protein